MPSRYEEFGLVALEALASGTPVIAFNSAGPSEFIENGSNGFLVKDVGEMAQKIIQMYELWVSQVKYKTIVNNCLHTAKKFDWKVIVDRLGMMFEDVKRDY